eukprot:1182368-Prorocentrum_minimum.AAC.1
MLAHRCGWWTVVQFSIQGTLAALVWIPIATAYKVLWAEAQKVDGWSTMPLMHVSLPWASLVTASMVPVLDPPGLLDLSLTANAACLILASGFAAFLVNWSGFLVIGCCSPLTHQVLGQAKSIVTMLGGYVLFGQHYAWVSLMGCAAAFVSVIVYTDATLQENAAQEALETKCESRKHSDLP